MGFLDFLKRKKNDDDEEQDFGDFEDFDDIDDDRPRTQVIDDDTELSEKTGDDDVILESEIEDTPSKALPDTELDMASDSETTDDDIEIPDFDDEDGVGDAKDKAERFPMRFVIAGATVLFIGVVGGVGFWVLGNGDEEVTIVDQLEEPTRGKTVGMAIPPRDPQQGGGLNAVDQSDQKPVAEVRSVNTPPKDQAARSVQTVPQPGLGAITVCTERAA